MMTKRRITWESIRHMVVWGLGAGAGLGFIYGGLVTIVGGILAGGDLTTAFVAAFVSAFAGLFLGGFQGLVSGLLDGLAIAGITAIWLRRSRSWRHYRATIYAVSGILTGLTAFLGFADFSASLGTTTLGGIFYTLVPTLIALVAALLATTRLVAWIENNSTALSKVG